MHVCQWPAGHIWQQQQHRAGGHRTYMYKFGVGVEALVGEMHKVALGWIRIDAV